MNLCTNRFLFEDTTTGCSETKRRLLRRSAAEALLIQNLEFQTIKCPSVVRPMYVRSEKSDKTPKNKVPKKTAFYEERNDLPGPLKSRLFLIS